MEILARMGWFLVIAIAVAYGTYLVCGSVVHAKAAGEYEPVMIKDELGANSHSLSGMVVVPSSCHDLSLRIEKTSVSAYRLIFTTWHDPVATCTSDPIPRAFRTLLFAPAAGVSFTATLDDRALPITVIQHVATPEQMI